MIGARIEDVGVQSVRMGGNWIAKPPFSGWGSKSPVFQKKSLRNSRALIEIRIEY